ncbi:MAG: NADH-quinone oxidoreductase subunit J [Desulfovermiculus sp.]
MAELSILTFFVILSVLSALMVVCTRNIVHCALWMIISCVALAAMFLLLHLQFLALLQIIVYAGAIMMFILYAIMMLNLRFSYGPYLLWNLKTLGLVVLVLFMVGLLGLAEMLPAASPLSGPFTVQALEDYGEVGILATRIFSDYIIAFELVSVLLTAGVVGALALAKKDR